jgi:nucleoside-diphosphate-sugar epimerase
MKQISILGCGWLGFPLAKSFISDGFIIKGSTTSESKITILQEHNIDSFLIELEENQVKGLMDDFLDNSQILIIDIPPKLRGNNPENFVTKIQNCIPFIEKSLVKKVLFVSSTSVYGEDNSIITEESIANPDTESGKQLLQVEKILRESKNFETTILRFGGLISEDRNPIKMLSGKTNIQNPEAPVNLIHQNDCINIIKKIIEIDAWNEVFNAVNPSHPTRKEYYNQKAIEMNLPLPEFDDSKSIGKIILSNKILKQLNYTFTSPI